MKKLFSLVLVVVFGFIFFSACSSKSSKGLDFETYFPTVSATTFGNETTNFQTESVMKGEMSVARYSYFVLSGDAEWIYGLSVESFSFEVFANSDVDMDLLIEFINVEKGTEVISGTNRFRITKIANIDANKKTKVVVQVNDKFPNKSGSIKISVNDATPFSENSELKWSIVGLSFVAHH